MHVIVSDASSTTRFDHVPVNARTRIVIKAANSTDSRSDAATLAIALRAEIAQLGPNVTETTAGADPESWRELRVLVSDGVAPFVIAGPPPIDMLPVIPAAKRTNFADVFSGPLRLVNAALWYESPADVVSAVLAMSGITPAPRAFISYRQRDSAGLAIQLFDALSHAGFDVFLDHFRISPGVDFQAKLGEQLGDKSMVVILESANILESEWTLYEINKAKSCRMAICSILLPGGVQVPDIDAASRTSVAAGDFVGNAFNESAVLDDASLAKVVAFIRQQHDRGMARRRAALRGMICNALTLAGASFTIDDAGAVNVPVGSGYIIWSTLRAPDLADFHVAHRLRNSPACGVVVGLSQLFAAERAAQITWLSGVSEIILVDEGQISAAAEGIAKGTFP